MQEPRVDFYFQPRRDDRGAGHDDANGAPGLVALPAALLERHGARVLNPEDAVAVPGRPPDQPPVRSTVYRARTLLVPDSLQRDTQFIETVNTALGRVGMTLEPTTPSPDYRELQRRNPDLAAALQELPRVAVLKPVRRDDEPAHPRVVDAWVALQTLREAATEQQQKQPAWRRRRHAVLDVPTVATISLEHLLISSSIAGSGAHGTGGGLTPSASDAGPAPTDSYTFFSGDTRFPVAVCLDAPERRNGLPEHGRRPVVAVLDTGIREHPWLDVTRAAAGDGYHTEPDGFVMIDPVMQGIIRAEGEAAQTEGDRPRQVIEHPWDTPVTADPLLGELDTDTGHCTFISGIVRQVAPDARVLAIRIMHSDGIVNEGDILCALAQLAVRVALAEAGDMNEMVDVVSLSLGYFSEAGDAALTSGLKQAIDILLGLGVTVVAAAGNYSTSRKFYPAAFASQNQPDQVPLVSVGALNPNRSQAVFSDGGRWVTAWACGGIMISTFPVDVQGSQSPEIRMRTHPDNAPPDGLGLPDERAALDPDDYRGGFAAWSGTSFSAPLAAARIARELLRQELRLDGKGEDCARKRALAALKKLGWEG
jgi:subtilisin family serine protease